MYPPIFEVCAANASVQDALGSSPCRLYPFGFAESANGGPPALPYAVWQTISGIPENYLERVPDTDSWSIQVDVYGSSPSSARSAAEALRDAIEPVAHVTSLGGETRDPETMNFRYTISVDWIAYRDPVSY